MAFIINGDMAIELPGVDAELLELAILFGVPLVAEDVDG